MRRMLRYDLRWYEAHFTPADGHLPKPIRGEISPLYARLKAWQVKRIAKLLPNLRVILTLRHPIERAWSQALFELGHLENRDVRRISSVEFLRQFDRPRNRLSSDYCRTIEIWSNAFGRDALHVDFFDRLQDDAEGYINGILGHIGAASPWTLPPKFIRKKVHATTALVRHERQIPEVVRWYFADRLLESTERLNDLLEGRVSKWVDEMRAIRSKTRLNWRILGEINRILFSMPERLAYESYHAILDARLWLRWQQFQSANGLAPSMNG